MKMSHKRVLRIGRFALLPAKARTPADLVRWLNAEQKTPDHRRIERLLDKLAAYVQAVLSFRPESERQVASWTRGVAMPGLNELQKELARYRMRPQLRATAGQYGPASSELVFGWDCGQSRAAQMVLLITDLGRDGLLWRIRRCRRCQLWFFARGKGNDFCSIKCRQAAYKSSPEWWEYRRKYMRRYRQQNTASLGRG